MGRTIIQPIGPLYGEAVNGTVFGRPNGSIYVPPTNTIKATIPDDYITILPYGGRNYLVICNSSGIRTGMVARIAESQDVANYMSWEISTDSEFSTSDIFNSTPGNFNITDTSLARVAASYTIGNGETYYLRAALFSASGVPVAYSEVFTITGVSE